MDVAKDRDILLLSVLFWELHICGADLQLARTGYWHGNRWHCNDVHFLDNADWRMFKCCLNRDWRKRFDKWKKRVSVHGMGAGADKHLWLNAGSHEAGVTAHYRQKPDVGGCFFCRVWKGCNKTNRCHARNLTLSGLMGSCNQKVQWWGITLQVSPSLFFVLCNVLNSTVWVMSLEKLSWHRLYQYLPRFFRRCPIHLLTLNKVAGARDTVKMTDCSLKAPVMISSGEDYVRRVCHVDGWRVSPFCVSAEEEDQFKGDRDGCMHV